VKLREIAHARAGDKGRLVNVSVIAHRLEDFGHLETHVTAERVKEHFGDLVEGEVTRYVLPRIGALNFVLAGVRGGGVTRSLALDAHGKSFGSLILELELPDRRP